MLHWLCATQRCRRQTGAHFSRRPRQPLLVPKNLHPWLWHRAGLDAEQFPPSLRVKQHPRKRIQRSLATGIRRKQSFVRRLLRGIGLQRTAARRIPCGLRLDGGSLHARHYVLARVVADCRFGYARGAGFLNGTTEEVCCWRFHFSASSRPSATSAWSAAFFASAFTPAERSGLVIARIALLRCCSSRLLLIFTFQVLQCARLTLAMQIGAGVLFRWRFVAQRSLKLAIGVFVGGVRRFYLVGDGGWGKPVGQLAEELLVRQPGRGDAVLIR